ncbi:MAG: SgcJ/EcaC family oxidoreductase [Bryobacteraceae bacterium]|nr:SgcJ/EcaC family oxidoreductase [Bryobacteraceae bacterium]
MRLVLLIVFGVGCSLGQIDEIGAVKDVVRRYVDARENRDPKLIASLFAPDADQLVSSGEWRRGAPSLVKGMLGSSERNSGKRTITVETVRFLGSDVAIADGRYEIAGSRPMWSTFVMRKHSGAWRIEAIRNMAPTAAP